MKLKTPEYPQGRDVVVLSNDITYKIGSFGPEEDLLFLRASELARAEGIPRIYIAANSGARIGFAEEIKHKFQVGWVDPEDPYKVCARLGPVFSSLPAPPGRAPVWGVAVPNLCSLLAENVPVSPGHAACPLSSKGFKYLYLTPQDYTRISSMNAVHCQHVEEAGESR